MPRRVGDDELASVGGEVAVGDINRDTLLALGAEPVHEQREIKIFALRSRLAAVRLQRGELIVEQRLAVIEQPAEQGRLAIVDRPAGKQA